MGGETERSHVWYESFFDGIQHTEDDGTSAIRLLGELLASCAVTREGDYLNDGTYAVFLTPDDQHLIRRIEAAAEEAAEAESSYLRANGGDA